MGKLTKRSIDAADARATDYFIWDDELAGFGIRILPSGKKTYVVQYRVGGATRRTVIGRHGPFTPDQARNEAADMLRAVSKGGDPSKERKHYRKSPTVAELCDRFLSDHVAHRCKLSTQREYRRSVELFIKPAIGNAKVADITRPDIDRLHQSIRHIPYQANRTLGVISKMFNLAEIWGFRPDGSNPCRHVAKFQERRRERYLNGEELRRLGIALDESRHEGLVSDYAIAAIALLVLTGCRLSEIQTLKWSYVGDTHLNLPDSKTGAKKVYLGTVAQDTLARIPRLPGNEYVIAGKVAGQHLTDLQRPWQRIRSKAGLGDVRLHDLRHTFASSAVGSGVSLPMIGKLLGHTQMQTTARYAHLADDPVHKAATLVSNLIASSLAIP